MKIILFIFSSLLISTSAYAGYSGESPTWQSTPDKSSIEACINAAESGDTINVSAGDGTEIWNDDVELTKSLNLIGPGKSNLIITANSGAFEIHNNASRVSGFTFYKTTGTDTAHITGQGWRIDNCKFEANYHSSTNLALNIDSINLDVDPKGLIDNCEFINGRILVSPFSGYSGPAKNNAAWAKDLALGTEEAVYVEDCTFTRSGDTLIGNSIDSNRSGRWVFRYNTVNNQNIMAHSYQVATERGTRKWEIYGNTMTSSYPIASAMFLRAGTGVIFNNDLSGYYSSNRAIGFDNWRTFRLQVGSSVAGLCDGDSPYDKNYDSTGWWCRDQIGTSTDEYEKLTNPQAPQTRVPVYIWDNTDAPVTILNGCGDHIKANRDYYIINSGTTLPASCTVGQGYWKEDEGDWNKTVGGDQGVLYTCTSTKTWELNYIPYEYPHPLRGEGDPDETPPTISATGPTGEQTCSSDPQSIEIVATTNETAVCKIGIVGASWSMMAEMDQTGGYSHSDTNTYACGGSYSRDIICRDPTGNESSPSTVSFSVAAPGEDPTCDENHNYCTTQIDCEAAGWYWYDDDCHDTEDPTVDFPTLSVLDDFNRESIGDNWTNIGGSFEISSGVLAGTGSTHNRMLWNAGSYDSAEAYTTITNASNQVQLFLRSALDASRWVFVSYVPTTSPAYRVSVGWFIDDPYEIRYIGSPTYQQFSNGDKIGAKVVGNTYTVYRQPSGGDWYELMTVVDTNPVASSGYIGVHTYGTSPRVDDFGGGDLSAVSCENDAGACTNENDCSSYWPLYYWWDNTCQENENPYDFIPVAIGTVTGTMFIN